MAQLEFKQPAKVSEVTVWWFDDTGSGECRLPASWRLSYRAEDGSWKPVERASAYTSTKDGSDRVTFTPVNTGALRLDIKLAENFSAGLYEWTVNTLNQ